MNTFFKLISNNMIQILCTIITAVFSYIGIQIKKTFKQYTESKIKKEVIEKTVNYVEQTCKELSCSKKKEKAVEKSLEWLREKKISVSNTELEILIESAVKCL